MRLGDGLELGALAAVEHTPSVRRDSNTQEDSGLYWKKRDSQREREVGRRSVGGTQAKRIRERDSSSERASFCSEL